MIMRDRILSKDEVYMGIAYLLSQRSKCKRLQVGCIIVRDKHIIASGCNGPTNYPGEEFCSCPKQEPCGDLGSVHAEMNAIAYSARCGFELENSTIYLTHSPCFNCAKLIKQSNILRVVYSNEYRDKLPIKYLLENDIKISQYSGKLP